MSSGPTLTLAEAAKQSTMSKTTLRRRLHANQIEGAERADDGSWSIPISSLVQAGLLRATTPPDEPEMVCEHRPAEQPKPATEGDPGNLLVNIAKPGPRTPQAVLAVELTTLRHRAELAEQERNAAKSELDRADQTIQDLRRNVDLLERMLPAASSTTDPPSETKSDEPDDASEAPDPLAAALESTVERLRRELESQRLDVEHARALANAGWRERRRLRKQQNQHGARPPP